MKIVYEGFYGFKNTGDDAFIEISSWGAEKYWNCKNNTFLGTSLPKTVHKINTRQIFSSIKGFDRVNLISHLTNSDYLISSGGSTFSDLPGHSNKALARHYQKFNKKLKLGAIGVSIGPFKNSKAEHDVVSYLQSLDFLSVRDHRSFLYVNSLNLPYQPVNAFDLAALLPFVYENTFEFKAEPDKQPTIGISICNYESYKGGSLFKEQNRNAFFKEVIDLIAKHTNAHFKVFIINGNKKFGDHEATNQLIKDIDSNRVTIVPYLSNVEETWNEVKNCNLMISTRLHASIFACYAQIPFLLIEYHEKCSDFLSDVGQDESYRVYDGQVSPSSVLQKVNGILGGSYIKPKFINETIALSAKNFTSHNLA
jgi:polysaccharide pyruvyl transferase WcaK-like protein